MEHIAVIGAGMMGHGIAQVFAVKGHPVTLYDPVTDVLNAAPAKVRANLKLMGLDENAADNIRLCDSLNQALRDAEFVFEAGPENLAIKQRIFADLANNTSETCVLASNTSVIPIASIAAKVADGGRVLGTHWWNPPYLIPLVEVVQAERTDVTRIERCIALLQRAGKIAVHVKRDVPGFVANRMQHALWREAISIVENGICDADTVDLCVKNSFGMRLPQLGPLENADLVGLDLTLAIHKSILSHIESSGDPSPLLARLVESGQLGMKSGQGFYSWSEKSADALRTRLSTYLKKVVMGK